MLAAGWTEHALHDAVAVCGLFNLMNRLVDGLGITAGEDYFITAARRLPRARAARGGSPGGRAPRGRGRCPR